MQKNRCKNSELALRRFPGMAAEMMELPVEVGTTCGLISAGFCEGKKQSSDFLTP